MANLVRTAKSDSEWTGNELLAFNIRVVNANMIAFFNTTQLPAAHVSETILNNAEKPNQPLQKDDRLFFRYLGLVERPKSPEPHVEDFAAFILRMLNYDDQDRVVCLRPEFSFPMAGQRVDTKSDLCVRDESDYLLLVQEDKAINGSLNDPEPKLIAGAIAAFYQNNLRRNLRGLPQLESKHILAITMMGSAPIFYRIPVTVALLNALVTATYPAEETIVLKYYPPVPNPDTYARLGMRPLGNRRVVLQCLEAFKALL
ncbi:hypothetical protein GALMADRAFT_100965 [Galerina marginata CBS 339.88]|uniref:Uncharacterized protein n=1 Tax=Galerina marginata (strain CBS 339.88) TaxID=685588 RepID=A0A067T042_GALM3|nr:hypothetical protein GALMADRAFT_100965 [Galerina marginata CBS 339.88]